MTPVKKYPYLSESLRAYIAAHPSVNQLAKLSGVSQPVISRFVNGSRGITLDTASRLAQSLGLKLTE